MFSAWTGCQDPTDLLVLLWSSSVRYQHQIDKTSLHYANNDIFEQRASTFCPYSLCRGSSKQKQNRLFKLKIVFISLHVSMKHSDTPNDVLSFIVENFIFYVNSLLASVDKLCKQFGTRSGPTKLRP